MTMVRKVLLVFGLVILLSIPAMAIDVDETRKAAEQGDVTAQYNLGIAYTTGPGVPLDFTEAVE